MIDVHTHILPGVDDGPRTMEESIQIVQRAAEEGVTAIVATPHVLEDRSPMDQERVDDAFNRIKRIIAEKEIGVEVVLGAELFISPDLPARIRRNNALTIDSGNRYVLLELPAQEIQPFMEQTIFELLLQGIVPIISHPERNLAIQNDPDKLFHLVQRGVLAQLDAGSLLGKYGKKTQNTAKALLSNNLIHMIASDVHSTPNGSYSLSLAVKIAAGILGRERAMEMVTVVPEKVIRGRPIHVMPPKPVKRNVFRRVFGDRKR